MRLAYYAITHLSLFTRLFLSIVREWGYTAPFAALADCTEIGVSLFHVLTPFFFTNGDLQRPLLPFSGYTMAYECPFTCVQCSLFSQMQIYSAPCCALLAAHMTCMRPFTCAHSSLLHEWRSTASFTALYWLILCTFVHFHAYNAPFYTRSDPRFSILHK